LTVTLNLSGSSDGVASVSVCLPGVPASEMKKYCTRFACMSCDDVYVATVPSEL
jgi:hypothetical protein